MQPKAPSTTQVTRRQIVQASAGFIVTIPLVSVLTARPAFADLPILAENDPVAAALGYVHDATKTDTVKFPKRAGADSATQFCSNCLQYAEVGDNLGTCAIFAGKRVAAGGWCNVWVLKP